MNFDELVKLNCLSEADLQYISDFCFGGLIMGYNLNDIANCLAHVMERESSLEGHIYRKNLKYVIRAIGARRHKLVGQIKRELRKVDKLKGYDK